MKIHQTQNDMNSKSQFNQRAYTKIISLNCSNFTQYPHLIYRSFLNLYKMNHQTNSLHLQSPPLYNLYLSDQLDLSPDPKETQSSTLQGQNQKKLLNLPQGGLLLQQTQKTTKEPQISLLEAAEYNQFIPGYAQNQKNASSPIFKIEAPFLKQFQQQQEFISGTAQQQQNQPEHQTSFLLDSATYKEIWQAIFQISIEENSKKVQFCSNFDVESLASIQDVCSIHQKPFEIVCIEDKTLVCSHCAIFGQHKSHSLAPLNEIEKQIMNKKFRISQITSEYKALQLNIKEKSFSCQFIEKIVERKKDVKLQVGEEFKKIKQFISNYEQQINNELNQLYEALEQKITQCIKRTCLDSNTAAFERWQKDAWTIIQQLTSDEVSMKTKVNLFLNNFTSRSFLSHSTSVPELLDSVSLQMEGQKYFQQIKQQLNLSIAQVMKTVDLFRVSLNQPFQQNIKSLISFQCDSKINDLIEEHRLTLIDERITIINSFDSVKMSMKHLNKPNPNTPIPKMSENQQASTVVSIGQSTPIYLNNLFKNYTNLNSPSKYIEPLKQPNQKTDIQAESVKKSLKYKRYETLQDMKKLQQNIRNAKSPVNITDAKSECGQKKRRISPCLKEMVGSDHEKLFMSSLKPRIGRYTSKDFLTHKRSPSDEMKKQTKNIQVKHKLQRKIQKKGEDPLKTLQNYAQSDTQTLDLSDWNLSDTQILYFVQKASKIRKIRHLKLSFNLLTSQGFQKIIPYLSSCNSINLSNNRLSEAVVELILRKREKLGQLKMLNLANNRLNERIIKERLQSLKKMNILVTL